jgi:hypothetical protein
MSDLALHKAMPGHPSITFALYLPKRIGMGIIKKSGYDIHNDDQLDKYKPEMSFDDSVADDYDERSIREDEKATVAFLEQLAQGGQALELTAFSNNCISVYGR